MLFVERARSYQPAFALSVHNASLIAAVCGELDGLPLALELAAAQLQVLGPRQLLERLHDRFQLLADPHRRPPAHHRTLQATLDWSFDMLDDRERRLFGCLAVFAGGWTLEAIEVVGAAAGVAELAILRVLGQLVDKSLVLTALAVDGSIQYRLLETLRAYAAATLAAVDRDRLLRQHALFYRDLAERAEPQLVRADQEAWYYH